MQVFKGLYRILIDIVDLNKILYYFRFSYVQKKELYKSLRDYIGY